MKLNTLFFFLAFLVLLSLRLEMAEAGKKKLLAALLLGASLVPKPKVVPLPIMVSPVEMTEFKLIH